MSFNQPLPCVSRVESQGLGTIDQRAPRLHTLAIGLLRAGVPEEAAIARAHDANAKAQFPLVAYEVERVVRSHYASGKAGFDCSLALLHEPENTLCSALCPRYRPEWGRATDGGNASAPANPRPEKFTSTATQGSVGDQPENVDTESDTLGPQPRQPTPVPTPRFRTAQQARDWEAQSAELDRRAREGPQE